MSKLAPRTSLSRDVDHRMEKLTHTRYRDKHYIVWHPQSPPGAREERRDKTKVSVTDLYILLMSTYSYLQLFIILITNKLRVSQSVALSCVYI